MQAAVNTDPQPDISILEVMTHPELLGPSFAGPSWRAWRAFLAAFFALPLSNDDFEIYRAHTGRTKAPTLPSREAFLIGGRRSGKTIIAALIAVFIACFRRHDRLVPGETGIVMVLAADKRQAKVCFRYIEAMLTENPMLRSMVEHVTREAIKLSNGIAIEVHTSNFRRVRGYTLIAAILDELAFWQAEDSANPDVEVLSAVRPAMATTNGLLIGLSSPYGRRGALWDAYRKHFGKDDDPVLIWQAPTRAMNPLVTADVIDDAYEEDAVAAATEYGAEFRKDIESFVTREALEAVTVPGLFELAPLDSHAYVAFCDPSGGSQDSMTLAIAHREDRGIDEVETAVLDAIREIRPPFSPEAAVAELAKTLQGYGISEVAGDRYGGSWPADRFAKHGISYVPAEKSKSDIYREFLPLLNSRRAELLDNPRLRKQLLELERRTTGGRETIDHAPRAHDDVANACAGACVLATEEYRGPIAGVW